MNFVKIHLITYNTIQKIMEEIDIKLWNNLTLTFWWRLIGSLTYKQTKQHY